jgi:hypothetical protein
MAVRGGKVALVLGSLALTAGVLGLLGNEWRAGRVDRALTLLPGIVADADPAAADLPADRPLRLTGTAAGAVLVDPLLPVRIRALRLDRTVEMYQYKVLEGPLVDRAVRHERVWSERLMDSSRFAARSPVNPSHMPLTSLRQRAEDARLGRLALSAEVVDLLPAGHTVAPERPGPVTVAGTVLQRSGDGYRSGDPRGPPSIGDVRIRLAAVPAGPITVIGGVADGHVVAWPAANGTPVLLVGAGTLSVEQMIADATRAVRPGLWQGRLGAGAVTLFGLLLLWPRRDSAASGLAAVFGRHPLGSPIMATIVCVAIAMALGWALFRNPLPWP